MYAERQHSMLVDRLLKFGKWLAAPPVESPVRIGTPADYAGLDAVRSSGQGIEQRAFTDQLCNLQQSLRLAGEGQPQRVKIASQIQ